MRTAPVASAALLSALLSAATLARAGAPEVATPERSRTLPIPARAQAKESPPDGWCGETAIQEGLLHLGVWAPQRRINQAGKPSHPDLYSPDIPVALTALGVRFAVYAPRARGFEPFAAWVRAAIDAGDPVLAGVKILPTAHPEWGLDHFVLVVGHGDDGLLVNTTWGTREWVTDRNAKGISFVNAGYALRLTGVAVPAGARPARLTIVAERADAVEARVTCDGLAVGSTYAIERRADVREASPAWSVTAVAALSGAAAPAPPAGTAGGRVERDVVLQPDRVARFSCAPR